MRLYAVFAVNPLQASRYWERHGVFGAKSDSADGHLLTDVVRADSPPASVTAGLRHHITHGRGSTLPPKRHPGRT